MKAAQSVLEETPEEVENAILHGLRYLVREALASRLHRLAEVITTAVDTYEEEAKAPDQQRRH